MTQSHSTPTNLLMRNTSICPYKKLDTLLDTEAVSVIAPNWEQGKSPSIGEWQGNDGTFHATEYYSAVKTIEPLIYITTRFNFKILMLSKQN